MPLFLKKSDMTWTQHLEGLQSKKVLVVDNDPDNSLLSELYLNSLWISKENISVARDGFEAVAKAEQELFDVIIMDVKLPGIDGIEVSKRIKSHYNWVAPKIVGLTGHQFITREPETEIFDDIMIKPISKKDFSAKILEALNGENKEN